MRFLRYNYRATGNNHAYDEKAVCFKKDCVYIVVICNDFFGIADILRVYGK